MQDPKSDSKVAVDKTQEGITDELAFTIHKIGCEVNLDALVYISCCHKICEQH